MTWRKMAGMEAGVEDLQFEIKPRSTVFEDRPIPCFVLYLEKGKKIIIKACKLSAGTKVAQNITPRTLSIASKTQKSGLSE